MAKKEKITKDQHLIEYYAKKVAKFYEKIDKNSFITHFGYGEALVVVKFEFENKIASVVSYEISEIYDLYASDRYSSSVEFAKDFIAKLGTWYDLNVLDSGTVLIVSDIKGTDYDPNTISQGFDDIGLFMYEMSKFLNLNVEAITEADIRAFNIEYFDKHKKQSRILSIVGLVAIIVGIILSIVGKGKLDGISIPLMLIGIIVFVIFLLKTIYYNIRLSLSKRKENK